MGFLNELARRWADSQLAKEAGELRYELVTTQATNERLLQQRDNANRLVNQHEATIKQFNNAVQDLQDQLGLEQKLSAELVVQRDEALKQAADLAAENVILTDAKRHLEASLSGVREELRQVRREHALAEEAVAELRVTADGLGLAMADLERAAQRRVILPGQRADLHDADSEKRYEDGLGDA